MYALWYFLLLILMGWGVGVLQKQLLSLLVEHHKKQELLLSYYADNSTFEMMFLVKWSTLEYFIKNIASEYRKEVLICCLHEWVSYMENDGKKPLKVPNFNLLSNSIPQKNEFITSLNYYGFDAQEIWSVMDSKGKHRKYRNELAHTGKRLSKLAFDTLYPDLEKITDKFLNVF